MYVRFWEGFGQTYGSNAARRLIPTPVSYTHLDVYKRQVLTDDSPGVWKGERTRLFLSDIGYGKALDSQAKGQIKILSHAKVRNGDLFYDHKEQIR